MTHLREELILKFKTDVIEACGVLDVKPEEVDNEAPLFGSEPLSLDSLDALELIMILEKNFDIKIKGTEGSNQTFKSFNAIADHILAKAPEEKVLRYIQS